MQPEIESHDDHGVCDVLAEVAPLTVGLNVPYVHGKEIAAEGGRGPADESRSAGRKLALGGLSKRILCMVNLIVGRLLDF